MNRINYDELLFRITQDLDHRPALLLHSCCAPCSSYCLIRMLPHFDITCFYYNPNITDINEYEKRFAELERLAGMLNEEYDPVKNGYAPIAVMRGDYEPELFMETVKARELQECPEGGKRCEMCFDMRLRRTYEVAAQKGFEYFTTTLTISPLKDAQLINSIGFYIAEDASGVKWLPSDFKKRDGFKQSIELSRKYGLYRQNYCGCVFSRSR